MQVRQTQRSGKLDAEPIFRNRVSVIHTTTPPKRHMCAPIIGGREGGREGGRAACKSQLESLPPEAPMPHFQTKQKNSTRRRILLAFAGRERGHGGEPQDGGTNSFVLSYSVLFFFTHTPLSTKNVLNKKKTPPQKRGAFLLLLLLNDYKT